jgi:hypothetical protein
MNVDGAKVELGFVFERKIDSDDLAGIFHLEPERFERLVQLVEDHDPHWLTRRARDPRYPLGVRLEIVGMMRGSQANQLLLELLGS